MAKKPKLFTNVTLVCNKCGAISEVSSSYAKKVGKTKCWKCSDGFLKPKGQHGTTTKD